MEEGTPSAFPECTARCCRKRLYCFVKSYREIMISKMILQEFAYPFLQFPSLRLRPYQNYRRGPIPRRAVQVHYLLLLLSCILTDPLCCQYDCDHVEKPQHDRLTHR